MMPVTATQPPATDTSDPAEPLPSNDAPNGELTDLTNEQLVERFCDGNPAAFSVLHDRLHESVVNWIIRRGVPPDDAEDIAQDAWRQTVRHIHRYDPDRASFRSWVFHTAKNLATNHHRDSGTNPMTVMADIRAGMDEHDDRALVEGDLFADESHRPDDAAERREVRRQVEAAIERLPEHLRLTFLLRYRRGLKYARISDATGVKMGTIKSRLNRARKRFVEIVAEDAPEVLDRLGLSPETDSSHWDGN